MTADIDGPVNYVDYGGEGSPIVLVHGLGGNLINWVSLAPGLTAHGRVIAMDLPGFGRTPPNGRASTVPANRHFLHRFIEQVVGEPSLLIGNSMGGLISLLQGAEEPDWTTGLVLIDPAIPRPATALGDPRILAVFGLYSIPRAGERFVVRRTTRLGAEGVVREGLRMCTVDPTRIAPEVVAQLVEVAQWRAQQPWPTAAYLQAARSIVATLARSRRIFTAAQSVEAPVLLIHGEKDRLVPIAAARQLAARATGWQLRSMPDIGHIPMLEAPEQVLQIISDWHGAALLRQTS